MNAQAQEKHQEIDRRVNPVLKEPCEQPRHNYAGSCRDSAKAILQKKYEEALKRANDLHTILQMLPTSLTSQQDDALWNILRNL